MQPNQKAYQVNNRGHGPEITIPFSKRSREIIMMFSFISLFFGLVVFASVAGVIQKGSLTGGIKAAPIILIIVTMWLTALYCLAWQLFGKEIILVGPTEFCSKRDILGKGFTRKFKPRMIKNFKVDKPITYFTGSRIPMEKIIGKGAICFEYGKKIQRIGIELSVPDALEIAKIITNKFPEIVLVETQDSKTAEMMKAMSGNGVIEIDDPQLAKEMLDRLSEQQKQQE
ncbi:hypothetical protein ACFL96_08240 [Thermoproteota archaeon]